MFTGVPLEQSSRIYDINTTHSRRLPSLHNDHPLKEHTSFAASEKISRRVRPSTAIKRARPRTSTAIKRARPRTSTAIKRLKPCEVAQLLSQLGAASPGECNVNDRGNVLDSSNDGRRRPIRLVQRRCRNRKSIRLVQQLQMLRLTTELAPVCFLLFNWAGVGVNLLVGRGVNLLVGVLRRKLLVGRGNSKATTQIQKLLVGRETHSRGTHSRVHDEIQCRTATPRVRLVQRRA